MPVHMAHNNARRFFWTCPCGKTSGHWAHRWKADKDFARHQVVCNLNVSRND